MRPLGHHAGRERIAGFCYLNNIAIACGRALKQGRRVAVLDIDVHHGDGTQSIAEGRDGWLFASLHQSPLYPGSGLGSRGNCHNFPLPPGTDESAYGPAFERALSLVKDFRRMFSAFPRGLTRIRNAPSLSFASTPARISGSGAA